MLPGACTAACGGEGTARGAGSGSCDAGDRQDNLPHSYEVLLQLPQQQLESVLALRPELREQLGQFVLSAGRQLHVSQATLVALRLLPADRPADMAAVAPTGADAGAITSQ